MRASPLTLAAAAAIAWILGSPRPAAAISSFSRQYKTECSTCHAPFPRRNEFGEAFRRNGYVWPGAASTRENAPEEAFWLSGILKDIPVSFTLRSDVGYAAEAQSDKLSPQTDVYVHLGGSVRDRVGYFAHNVKTSGQETLAVVRRPLDLPLTVRVGKLVAQTILWKDNQNVTSTPLATQSLSINGVPSLRTPRDAVELTGMLGSRIFAAAGVADRPGQNSMEYYGHLAVKAGGTDFNGKEPDVDFTEDSVWDFLTVTVGAYGLVGTIEREAYDTSYYRAGVDLELQYRRLVVLTSLQADKDRDADGTGLDVESVLLLAELDYSFAPRSVVSVRFENEDVGNAEEGIVKRFIAGAGWVPIEAVTLKVDGIYTRTQASDDRAAVSGILRLEVHL